METDSEGEGALTETEALVMGGAEMSVGGTGGKVRRVSAARTVILAVTVATVRGSKPLMGIRDEIESKWEELKNKLSMKPKDRYQSKIEDKKRRMSERRESGGIMDFVRRRGTIGGVKTLGLSANLGRLRQRSHIPLHSCRETFPLGTFTPSPSPPSHQGPVPSPPHSLPVRPLPPSSPHSTALLCASPPLFSPRHILTQAGVWRASEKTPLAQTHMAACPDPVVPLPQDPAPPALPPPPKPPPQTHSVREKMDRLDFSKDRFSRTLQSRGEIRKSPKKIAEILRDEDCAHQRPIEGSEHGSVLALFKNKEKKAQEEEAEDVYSKNWVPPKFDPNDPKYGRPKEGSLTQKRGIAAGHHIGKEIITLCEVITEYGYEDEENGTFIISFGQLFNVYQYISDKVVGMLLRARKHGLVMFEGEMLFQRRDEEVPILLLKPLSAIRRMYAESDDPAFCLTR